MISAPHNKSVANPYVRTLALPRLAPSKSPKARNMISTAATNFFICLFICSLVAAGFALAEEDFAHWCLLPMILCGALIGMDALDWIRGRLDIFDPVGILGV